MSQKVEKVPNFLDPPPSDLIWEKFEIEKILNFGNPPRNKKNRSLKHLELPKNHFKTNLFFFSTEAFKVCIYIWEKMKIWPPPPLLSKSPYFELWTF